MNFQQKFIPGIWEEGKKCHEKEEKNLILKLCAQVISVNKVPISLCLQLEIHYSTCFLLKPHLSSHRLPRESLSRGNMLVEGTDCPALRTLASEHRCDATATTSRLDCFRLPGTGRFLVWRRWGSGAVRHGGRDGVTFAASGGADEAVSKARSSHSWTSLRNPYQHWNASVPIDSFPTARRRRLS